MARLGVHRGASYGKVLATIAHSCYTTPDNRIVRTRAVGEKLRCAGVDEIGIARIRQFDGGILGVHQAACLRPPGLVGLRVDDLHELVRQERSGG